MSTVERRVTARRVRGEPVTVVGAGPAGLACAIALARAGQPVVVREWRNRVGGRFHGDFQGLENWSDARDVLDELAAEGIEITFEHRAVSEGTVFDDRGHSYRIQADRPLYYLVRRGADEGTLDWALLRQAAAAGAEIRRGDRVETISTAAVLAGGPRRADAIAVGYVFDTDMADGDWLALGEHLAPLGYAYLLVHGGRGTVASCMFTDFKRQAEHVQQTVRFFGKRVGLQMRNPRSFGGFANFRLPRTAVQGGHAVVGEQAGFQDALAGFGMRYALRSGLLAARSILEGVDYASLWQRELLPSLRTGVVNRFIFNSMGERGRRVALARLQGRDTGLVLRRLYQPSLLSRALYPLARFCYRVPLRDRSCNHLDCQCVWCQCQAELKASIPGQSKTTD